MRKRILFVALFVMVAPIKCLLFNEPRELPPPAVRTVLVAATEEISTATAKAEPSVTKTSTPREAIPTATQTPTIDNYVVLEGDVLSGIANKLGIEMYLLAAANGISNPDNIYEGQVLTIPGPDFKLPPKVIVVSLSQQKVFTFEDDVLIKEFIVSTGIPGYETVLGEYPIYIKLEKTRMTGPGYDLANVPWTMYFFEGYGLHGTYWHNNFGRPMSHGCVNLRTEDAKWLFDWAPLGTIVKVVN